MSVLVPEHGCDIAELLHLGCIKLAEVYESFKPDYTPQELQSLGVYDEMYGPDADNRPASMVNWPEHWLNEADPKGWLQWYDRYSGGRRIDDDVRQISRWKSFKARHGAQFAKKPSPRRAIAMQHWAINPLTYLDETQREAFEQLILDYRNKKKNRRKAAEYAKGIPDKRYYRPLTHLKPGQLVDYLIQQHNAYRAGCFSADTSISTPDGLKRIADILPGDIVTTEYGPRRVRKLWLNGHTSCWLQLSFGKIDITVTPNHKFYVDDVGWVPILLLTDKQAYVENNHIRLPKGSMLRLQQELSNYRQRQAYLQHDLPSPSRSSNEWAKKDKTGTKACETKGGAATLGELQKATISEASGRGLAENTVRDRRVFPRRNSTTDRLLSSGGDKHFQKARDSHKKQSPKNGTLPGEVYRREQLPLERRGVQQQSSRLRGRLPHAQQGTRTDPGRTQVMLRVVQEGRRKTGGTSRDTVPILKKSREQEPSTALHQVSCSGGSVIPRAGRELLRIKWLPRASRQRYDIEVEDVHEYVVGGLRVHNSHKDVRFGDEKGLYSWATRKELPTPGQRIALFEQPTHSHKYLDFEGEIPRGQYGGGTVKRVDKGKILVTAVKPDSIHFTLAHKRFPERFVLVRPKGWKKDKHWLLLNKTPTEGLPYNKVRYKKIPAEQVDDYIEKMRDGDTLEAKVDGASSLIKLLKNGVELVSYRTAKETGRPIVHTERVFHGLPKLDIPPELVGTILKGELYGVRNPANTKKQPTPAGGAGALSLLGGEEVIPPQELGGILNSAVAKSIEDQKAKQIALRSMVYDIQQLGKQPLDWETTPRPDRRKLIEQVLAWLPEDKFHISPAATDPQQAKELWTSIKGGDNPLTTEGVIMWPHKGPPMKGKLVDDYDVYITGTFPGEGKYTDNAIGGFTYGLEPGGETVGRIGTGFTDEFRRDAFLQGDAYKGRIARIRSQNTFPSGAHRAPAFLGLHEDYPTDKVASVLVPSGHVPVSDLVDLGITEKDAESFLWQSIKAEPPHWQQNQTALQNIANYLNRIQARTRNRIQQAYTAADWDAELSSNPQAARSARFIKDLKGIDPVIKDPTDKMFDW